MEPLDNAVPFYSELEDGSYDESNQYNRNSRPFAGQTSSKHRPNANSLSSFITAPEQPNLASVPVASTSSIMYADIPRIEQTAMDIDSPPHNTSNNLDAATPRPTAAQEAQNQLPRLQTVTEAPSSISDVEETLNDAQQAKARLPLTSSDYPPNDQSINTSPQSLLPTGAPSFPPVSPISPPYSERQSPAQLYADAQSSRHQIHNRSSQSSLLPNLNSYQTSPIDATSNFGSNSPYPPIRPGSSHTGLDTAPPSTYNGPPMNPSALDRTPSLSAPFPPDEVRLPRSNSSPSFTQQIRASSSRHMLDSTLTPAVTNSFFPLEASTSRLVPSMPPVQEICVECMMRDRDMVDVDVTSYGIWARASDVDYQERLAQEEAEAEADEKAALRSRHSHISMNGNGTDEGSQNGSGSMHGSLERRERLGRKLKRLGTGHPLTTASLKLWTSMNIPASNHRWRTLQQFITEQAHILDMQSNARLLATSQASYRPAKDPALQARQIASQASSPNLGISRDRSQSAIAPPKHIIIDRKEDQRSRSQSRASGQALRQRRPDVIDNENDPYYRSSSVMSMSPSTGQLPTGEIDRPDLEAFRRFSSPMPKHTTAASPQPQSNIVRNEFSHSSTDLRASSSYFLRSESPGRSSMAHSERPKSFWGMGGKWRGRSSAAGSMASYAPSGSMVDMHLGLFQERDLPPIPLKTVSGDARPSNESSKLATQSGKKKKKGFKKFFSKLVSPKSEQPDPLTAGSSPPYDEPRSRPLQDEDYYSEPLQPPAPFYLSSQALRHDRSASSSSQSSSPPSPAHTRSSFMPSPDLVRLKSRDTGNYLDSQSIKSHDLYSAQCKAPLETSTDRYSATYPPLRREKSLPAIPPDDSVEAWEQSANRSSIMQSSDEWDSVIGGGPKSAAHKKTQKTRSKVFSLSSFKKGGSFDLNASTLREKEVSHRC